MAVDSPLTCYVCGKTEDRKTIDLLGCLADQEKAAKRFKEKFGRKPESFLDICPKCRESESKKYIKNIEKKYGVYTVNGIKHSPYRCDKCNYVGKSEYALNQHKKDKHGG